MDNKEYKKKWEEVSSIEVKLVEKQGKCDYKIGYKFYYKHPYKRPENECNALLNVLDHYTWRVSLGFPSWESDDREVYRIHCPSRKGTVWEMRKADRLEKDGGT